MEDYSIILEKKELGELQGEFRTLHSQRSKKKEFRKSHRAEIWSILNNFNVENYFNERIF